MQRPEAETSACAGRDCHGEVRALSNADFNLEGESWEPPKGKPPELWASMGWEQPEWGAGMFQGELLAPKRTVSHSPQNSSLPLGTGEP